MNGCQINPLHLAGKKREKMWCAIDSEGKVVWSWNGLNDYDREPFADIKREGWMHVNSVTRLENGNTLVSMRNLTQMDWSGHKQRV